MELLDTSPWLTQPGPPAEAIILVGPPGAGKSTWAAEYAKVKEGHIHLLGAEWLHHRNHFLEEEQPEQRGEALETDKEQGLRMLCQGCILLHMYIIILYIYVYLHIYIYIYNYMYYPNIV